MIQAGSSLLGQEYQRNEVCLRPFTQPAWSGPAERSTSILLPTRGQSHWVQSKTKRELEMVPRLRQ